MLGFDPEQRTQIADTLRQHEMMIYAVFWGIAIPALILALLVWWGDRKEERSKNQR